jgi:hypothetical protein
MPRKRRLSKGRRDIVITETAVKLFREMRLCHCTCPPRDFDEPEFTECSACKTWWSLHFDLHRQLGRKLWQWPCVQHPAARSPYPKDSPADRDWKPDVEAQALWQALAAASVRRVGLTIALKSEGQRPMG